MALSSEHLRQALRKYVPEETVEDCIVWIRSHNIVVRIKKSRQSKYGDYRPPHQGDSHKITINHDLNKFAFLITFTHEIAHLLAFNKFGSRHAPHGDEWKREFKNLLIPLLYKNVFPDDVKQALIHYLKDPAASSCTDLRLQKALSGYNPKKEGWYMLEELEAGTVFLTASGKKFKKGNKLRKNYVCFDEFDHKYFVHPLMEVQMIHPL